MKTSSKRQIALLSASALVMAVVCNIFYNGIKKDVAEYEARCEKKAETQRFLAELNGTNLPQRLAYTVTRHKMAILLFETEVPFAELTLPAVRQRLEQDFALKERVTVLSSEVITPPAMPPAFAVYYQDKK
ncbi:MAG: hypothetical protein HYV68_02555 [Candidatus Taylorbacteria bacterium]|nr:hypothetical protein [Candidatus Taylorbacteria bacterium]